MAIGDAERCGTQMASIPPAKLMKEFVAFALPEDMAARGEMYDDSSAQKKASQL